jgi:hypothetical protein
VASLRLLAVGALALAASGCAMSGQLGSLFATTNGDGASGNRAQAYTAEGATGSITPARAAAPAPRALPPEADLVYARAAIVEVLTRGSKDTSAPWENPQNGARGTVTPVATAYSQDGATCHGFLASHIRDKSEAWLQGEACRSAKGKWEVKSLKPWKRT